MRPRSTPPVRQYPAPLLILALELESARGGGVRGEIAEAGHDEEDVAEREPRGVRIGDHPAAEEGERDEDPPARAGHTARDEEGGEHRADAERADEEAGVRSEEGAGGK